VSVEIGDDDQPWSPSSTEALRTRRHPAQVTADRLADHMIEFADYLTPRDRQSLEKVIATLVQIADGVR
jgi:hypothetical protein